MNKKTKTLLIITTTSSLLLLTYSITNIIIWKNDSNKTNNQIKYIQEKVDIVENEDTTNTIIIEQPEELLAFNPYWDYISMNLLNVDFSKLKKISNNIKGWIQVNGTNINYPFVQAEDNKYYLNHSFDKSINSAGWLFLDYQNNFTNNKNTIIYVHGRTDNTMFGSLKDVLTNEWLNNNNNYIIRISTEQENSLWQIFSTYLIKTTNDYLQTNFNSNTEYQEFLDMLLKRSLHDFETSSNYNDNILTLSTCYNSLNKMVVHAKLIKREVK